MKTAFELRMHKRPGGRSVLPSMSSLRPLCVWASLWLFLLLAAGCQRTQISDSMKLDHDPGDVDAQMQFWHDLADRPVTSNNEALHGLIISAEGSDPNQTYEQRVAWLTERGHLSESFRGAADEAVERGTVAQVLASMTGLKGGLTMRLLGPHPRYATRELVHHEIMRPGSPQQGLSGIEFIGIISRAEQLQETGT